MIPPTVIPKKPPNRLVIANIATSKGSRPNGLNMPLTTFPKLNAIATKILTATVSRTKFLFSQNLFIPSIRLNFSIGASAEADGGVYGELLKSIWKEKKTAIMP